MQMRPRMIRRTMVCAAVLLTACRETPSSVTGPEIEPSHMGSAGAVQAQERVAQAFRRATPAVLEVAGTVFADHDEERDKLVIGIEHVGIARAVEQVLERAGVAATDYEVRLVPAIHFVASLRDSWRPTRAGVQINFTRYVCSLGFNVADGSEDSFITASHCTKRQGGVESTEYWQPSRSLEPSAVAIEVEDPAYGYLTGCSKGKVCRYSDASRARYVTGVSGARVVAQTSGVNNGSLVVTGSITVIGKSATTNFETGTVVNKVGRTTGWTRGTVTNSCATVNVSGSKVQLLCQTLVQDAGNAVLVGGGDSGSGVWTGSASGATAVGLLWGGSGDGRLFVFSPFANVEQELGTLTVR